MGTTPGWVMASFTYPQLGVMYSTIKSSQFDRDETLARLVWAVANGWKRPKPAASGDSAVEALKKLGMVKEA